MWRTSIEQMPRESTYQHEHCFCYLKPERQPVSGPALGRRMVSECLRVRLGRRYKFLQTRSSLIELGIKSEAAAGHHEFDAVRKCVDIAIVYRCKKEAINSTFFSENPAAVCSN